MVRGLLAHLLRRLRGSEETAGSPRETPAARSGARVARTGPPPPPGRRAVPPPPPSTPVRLLLDDGTQVLVRADPLLERRVAGVLEAIGPRS